MDESKVLGGEYVGYGALFSNEPDNFDKIISDALLEISNAPGKNSEDERTLKRGYFHASKDSWNAHTAICNGTQKMDNAQFVGHFLHTQKYGTDVEKELYNDSAFYSLLTLNYVREPVIIVMEQGGGLNKDNFVRKFDRAYNKLLLGCYEQPFIPLSFPKIDFMIADKKDPGLQLCDFLLWASGRKICEKDTWHKEIKAISKIKGQPQDESFVDFQYDFMKSGPRLTTFYDYSDYDNNFERNSNKKWLLDMFFNAQILIEGFSASGSNPLPIHALHLKADINKFCKAKNRMRPGERVQEVAKLYLKLFDTIPLIDESTPKDIKMLMLSAKKIMGLLLREDLINGMRTIKWLSNTIALMELGK